MFYLKMLLRETQLVICAKFLSRKQNQIGKDTDVSFVLQGVMKIILLIFIKGYKVSITT